MEGDNGWNGGFGVNRSGSSAFGVTSAGGGLAWGAGRNTATTFTNGTGGWGGYSRDNGGGAKSFTSGGAGGGGAGSVGVGGDASGSTRGVGGTGTTLSLTGSSQTYGVGGAGGTGNSANVIGATGTANTGNGGGGGGGAHSGTAKSGGAGGSGLVVIRYKGTSAGTGGSVTAGAGTAAGYTLHTFTNTGTSAFDLSSLNLSTRLGAVENGVISGSGDLTFTGPGTLTLNAANTYSGVSRVNAGTLALGSSGSIGSSSGLSIANGANFNVSTVTGGFTLGSNKTLSGGGTIAGNVTISGTHSPGFSPGIQAINDDLAYTVGSNVVWELINNTVSGRGTDYDGVDVSGNLTFTGSTTITLDFALAGSLVNWSDSLWVSDITGSTGWKIFDVEGTISGFGNLQLATGSFVDGNAQTLASARPDAYFSLFEGADGVYLNYAAVPEPSIALLGGLGLLALLVRRR